VGVRGGGGGVWLGGWVGGWGGRFREQVLRKEEALNNKLMQEEDLNRRLEVRGALDG
jgi:hypothetical protein